MKYLTTIVGGVGKEVLCPSFTFVSYSAADVGDEMTLLLGEVRRLPLV